MLANKHLIILHARVIRSLMFFKSSTLGSIKHVNYIACGTSMLNASIKARFLIIYRCKPALTLKEKKRFLKTFRKLPYVLAHDKCLCYISLTCLYSEPTYILRCCLKYIVYLELRRSRIRCMFVGKLSSMD